MVNGRTLQLEKHVTLREGTPVRLPFQTELPVDAPPTASAVNSSMRWFVTATMFYAGFTSPGTESVRLPIAVVNADGAVSSLLLSRARFCPVRLALCRPES